MTKKIILGILLNGLALWGVTYFVGGIQYAGGIRFFILGGLVMGLINTFIKPILKLLTLPLHILTLGISLILLNGIIFWIFKVILDTIAIAGIGMVVSSVKTYFLGGFLFGLMNWFLHILFHRS